MPGGGTRPGGMAGMAEATDVNEGRGDRVEPGDDGLGEEWSRTSEPVSDSAVVEGAGEFVDFRAVSFLECFASDTRPGGGVEDREADV